MRIKFEISKISQFESQVVINNILSLLLKQDYIILNKTPGIVSFKDDNWQMRSKTDIFRKVDRGKFEIEALGNGTLIKFTYFISFVLEFIISTVLMILSFAYGYSILFISLPLLVQLILRIVMLKEVGKEIIENVVR